MNLNKIVQLKRRQLARLANQKGAAGELKILSESRDFVPRPTGQNLRNLLTALRETGVDLKKSSFDAIAVPDGVSVDFSNLVLLRQQITNLIFIEIKTASQSRVKDDFAGYFFAFTEGEVLAAEALGTRYKVLLVNTLESFRI